MPVKAELRTGAQHAGGKTVHAVFHTVVVAVGGKDAHTAELKQHAVLTVKSAEIAVAAENAERNLRKARRSRLRIAHTVAEKYNHVRLMPRNGGDHIFAIPVGVGENGKQHKFQSTFRNMSNILNQSDVTRKQKGWISMDFSKLKQELEQNKELKAAAESESGKKLMQRIDSAALERAAKTGDTETLKRVLGQVLTTPEGRALADKIQKAMGHE